jgi:hypothetical protein
LCVVDPNAIAAAAATEAAAASTTTNTTTADEEQALSDAHGNDESLSNNTTQTDNESFSTNKNISPIDVNNCTAINDPLASTVSATTTVTTVSTAAPTPPTPTAATVEEHTAPVAIERLTDAASNASQNNPACVVHEVSWYLCRESSLLPIDGAVTYCGWGVRTIIGEVIGPN